MQSNVCMRHMRINADEVLLTVDEVAEYLGLRRQTIYNRVSTDPTFPRLKVGGALRFRRSALDQWLEDQNPSPRKSA